MTLGIAYVAVAAVGVAGWFLIYSELVSWGLRPVIRASGRLNLGLVLMTLPLLAFLALDIVGRRWTGALFWWLAVDTVLIIGMPIFAYVWIRPRRIQAGWMDKDGKPTQRASEV